MGVRVSPGAPMYYLRKHEGLPILIIWKDHRCDNTKVVLDTILTGTDYFQGMNIITEYPKNNITTTLIAESKDREELVGLAAIENL